MIKREDSYIRDDRLGIFKIINNWKASQLELKDHTANQSSLCQSTLR